jgi:sugar phosphate permease
MNDIDTQSRLEADTMRRVTWRIIPFLIACYLLALIDRGNIGMAALQMNDDLGISKKVFGFAGSLFFFARARTPCSSCASCSAPPKPASSPAWCCT